MLTGSRGESRVSTLIYLLIAVLVIYVVIKIVPPYMDYYAMEDEVSQQVQMSRINSVPVIRGDILHKAQELEIDLGTLDIGLDANGNLQVYMYWYSTVDFGYGFTRDFLFEIDNSRTDAEEE